MGCSQETKKDCASWGLDIIPVVGSVKGIYEGFNGRDAVSGRSLNGFERTMSFVGATPLVGGFAKGASRTARLMRRISNGAKARNKFHNMVNGGKCLSEVMDDIL